MVKLEDFKGKRVLLLVGPAGPFFYRLAKDLKKVGAEVFKINFSGADWIFYPTGAINYRGKPENFPEFLKKFVKETCIDTVIVFNDCREVHRIAKEVLKDSVEFWVIEQGYIRPDFFTFEKGGINGYSKLPKDPVFYKKLKPKPLKVVKVEEWKFHWYFYSVVFFIAYILAKPFFPSSEFTYKNIHKNAIKFIITVLKQGYYSLVEKGKVSKFVEKNKGKYYFVPLQVHNDSQIRFHSDYRSVEEFIEEVLFSFSKYAPENTIIVFKHHPMDLGFKCYKNFIKNLSNKYGIIERVYYFKNGRIKELIENSIGCITINSTVGLEALLVGKPVKVMGKAVYDIGGLTYSGKLDEFWKEAFNFRPDMELLEKFVYYLIRETQVNGSVYKKVVEDTYTGAIYWFEVEI